MAWQDILGHDSIVDQFRQAIRANRLASTFLFVGPAGIGKRTFAERFAQALLCKSPEAGDPMAACGQCPACRQVRSGNHPDLEIVQRPKGQSIIPIELFKGDSKKGLQGLCQKISLKPTAGGRKIAIIDDADAIAEGSANALLKTLEEPSPRAVLILIGTSEQRQLPTIRSRCQVVRFRPLAVEQVAQILVDRGAVPDRPSALKFARASEGRVNLAWADPVLAEFRPRFFEGLANLEGSVASFAKEVGKVVDAVGKETQAIDLSEDEPQTLGAAKRARQELLMQAAAEFYRQVVRQLSGQQPSSHAEPDAEDPLAKSAADLAHHWQSDIEEAIGCVERCHQAIQDVYANANQATNLEAWLADLAR